MLDVRPTVEMRKELVAQPIVAAIMATAIVFACGFASLADSLPSLRAPFSLASTLPPIVIIEFAGVDLGSPRLAWPALAGVSMALAFLLWSYPLLSRRDRIPVRSLVAFVILALACVFFLAYTWTYGVTFQGALHTGAKSDPVSLDTVWTTMTAAKEAGHARQAAEGHSSW